jgi:hypothetical protein
MGTGLVASTPDRRDQDQMPSIWITSKSRLERSDAIHSFSEEREAGRFH